MSFRDGRQVQTDEGTTERGRSDWLQDHAPAVFELLARVPQERRNAKAGTILLFCEEGRWKVLVSDRAYSMRFWYTFGELHDGWLQELSEKLERGDVDWSAEPKRARR
jgi:hypothetical protein